MMILNATPVERPGPFSLKQPGRHHRVNRKKGWRAYLEKILGIARFRVHASGVVFDSDRRPTRDDPSTGESAIR